MRDTLYDLERFTLLRFAVIRRIFCRFDVQLTKRESALNERPNDSPLKFEILKSIFKRDDKKPLSILSAAQNTVHTATEQKNLRCLDEQQ